MVRLNIALRNMSLLMQLCFHLPEESEDFGKWSPGRGLTLLIDRPVVCTILGEGRNTGVYLPDYFEWSLVRRSSVCDIQFQ